LASWPKRSIDRDSQAKAAIRHPLQRPQHLFHSSSANLQRLHAIVPADLSDDLSTVRLIGYGDYRPMAE
jgi:hypothetical protein